MLVSGRVDVFPIFRSCIFFENGPGLKMAMLVSGRVWAPIFSVVFFLTQLLQKLGSMPARCHVLWIHFHGGDGLFLWVFPCGLFATSLRSKVFYELGGGFIFF